MSESSLERAFATQLYVAGLPEPEREYRFDPTRRYRFDFAWPDYRLAVEINGATWTRGGHSTGQGIQRDYDKLNLAQAAGWCVFQFTGADVTSGRALARVEQAIERAKAGEL